MELVSNIDKLIEDSGLRRKYIADRLGISTHQLKKISTGQSWANAPKMYILAELLGAEITELYIKKG